METVLEATGAVKVALAATLPEEAELAVAERVCTFTGCAMESY